MANAALPLLDGGAPVIGHLGQFFRDPVAVLKRGYRSRGRLFALNLMGRRMNVMLGPEHNRFFFEETDKLLSIRESMPFFLKMFSPDFYSFAEMEEYLRQRAIIMPRFKAASMKQYVPIMVEQTLNLVDRLGDDGEFDLIPTLGPLVMDIAAHSFMGREFHEKMGHDFFDLFRDFSAGMEFVLPLWLPTPSQIRSQRAKKKLHAILQGWIDKRRTRPLDPPDFFQTMIETRYPDGSVVPDETIRHLILLLVWAGHETTAGQVSWGLAGPATESRLPCHDPRRNSGDPGRLRQPRNGMGASHRDVEDGPCAARDRAAASRRLHSLAQGEHRYRTRRLSYPQGRFRAADAPAPARDQASRARSASDVPHSAASRSMRSSVSARPASQRLGDAACAPSRTAQALPQHPQDSGR